MPLTTKAQTQEPEPLTHTLEEPEEYVIWVEDRTNSPKIEKTEAAIHQILGTDAEIQKFKIGGLMSFWLATFKASLVEEIERLKGVSKNFLPYRYPEALEKRHLATGLIGT